MLEDYLGKNGFETHSVGDGVAMDRFLHDNDVDLIVLDLMLPGEDGLQIACRNKNSQQPIPVIILSARGDDVDRILGLEVGADDYLPKPFNPRELQARIRAVLRRCEPQTAAPDPAKGEVYSFGPFRLNMNAHTLVRDIEEVPLTSGEFNLLQVFVEHPNTVLNRERLTELLWGLEPGPFDRSIDVRVSRLRQKIEDDTHNPRYILTIRNVGYRFCPTVDGCDREP